MKQRHGLPNFAPEIAPYDLESSGKKSNDKYHGKKGKVDMDGVKQIGSIVGAIWLGGVFLLGYDWLWPLYLLLNVLDLLTHVPILGSLISWILTPLSWLGGFAYRGAPIVEQLGPLQEARLPNNQVSTYANSYVQQYGDAALILAAHDGYAQIVAALLASRDLGYRDLVEAADEHGNTALIYAAAKGFPQCTAALLKAGADPDIANQAGGGRTPLMEAAGAGHAQIVTALMATKANVELMDDYGNTALHYAAYNGHLPVVRELLKASPRRDVKNSNGETAASYATKNKHRGVADLLMRPPTQRERAAQASSADASDDLADLVAGKSGRKDAQGRAKGGAEAGAGKKQEEDHMSKLMKLFGKGEDEEAEKKPEDHISKMMQALAANKDKEKDDKEDHVSKLMSLFGGKEDKAKKAEDDTLSKLTKLFAGKEKEADESRLEELRKQHEEAELKAQKRSRVLLDCGINPADRGTNHIPELAALTADGRDITDAIDVVIISHFHLDHIGALPYLTEVLGYRGPIYMTHPTRAIAPVILEDYVRLGEERGHDNVPYKMHMIGACFERVSCFQLQERCVIGELAVTSFYAGHVIGAVMLLLECGGRSALYTGDFTMVPDHQLSAASVPVGLRPDVMITETTYATVIRSSKRQKEQDLCKKIQEVLDAGGKVLVPVFMMGRAQELCLICEKHWARAGLHYPIRIIRGMAEKALNFFRLFSSWSSDLVRKADKPFNFPHVSTCDVQDVIDSKSPMIVFAGPSMLTGGPALRIFKEWAPDRFNLVTFAGYCLPGTIGNEVMAKQKKIDVGGGETVDVRCQVEYMSYSDHTDARGILELMGQVAPRNVVLVHGAEGGMRSFKSIVEQRYRLPCSDPGVGETVDLSLEDNVKVLVSPSLLRHARPLPAPPPPLAGAGRRGGGAWPEVAPPSEAPCAAFSGLLRKRARSTEDEAESWELLDRSAGGATAAGLRLHRLCYRHEIQALPLTTFREAWAALAPELQRLGVTPRWSPAEPPTEGALPAGTAWQAALLSATKCRLQALHSDADASPTANGGLVVRATVEWAREDAQNPAVAQFLEALGAG